MGIVVRVRSAVELHRTRTRVTRLQYTIPDGNHVCGKWHPEWRSAKRAQLKLGVCDVDDTTAPAAATTAHDEYCSLHWMGIDSTRVSIMGPSYPVSNQVPRAWLDNKSYIVGLAFRSIGVSQPDRAVSMAMCAVSLAPDVIVTDEDGVRYPVDVRRLCGVDPNRLYVSILTQRKRSPAGAPLACARIDNSDEVIVITRRLGALSLSQVQADWCHAEERAATMLDYLANNEEIVRRLVHVSSDISTPDMFELMPIIEQKEVPAGDRIRTIKEMCPHFIDALVRVVTSHYNPRRTTESIESLLQCRDNDDLLYERLLSLVYFFTTPHPVRRLLCEYVTSQYHRVVEQGWSIGANRSMDSVAVRFDAARARRRRCNIAMRPAIVELDVVRAEIGRSGRATTDTCANVQRTVRQFIDGGIDMSDIDHLVLELTRAELSGKVLTASWCDWMAWLRVRMRGGSASPSP